jgi:hypothetical protein
MLRRNFVLLPLISICIVLSVQAQNWTGILAPSRAINWSSAGAGTIPARTTVCTTSACNTVTSAGTGATVSQINAAISSAPSESVVQLAAGVYNLSGEIIFNNKSAVSLRGAGANQTFLVFSSGGNGNGLGAVIYVANADTDYSGGPSNAANWTAGYFAGATSITFGSATTGNVSNLHVGSLLILDQLDDGSDSGNIFVCQTTGSDGTCSQEGGDANGRPGRAQNQQVVVTSISGSGPWTIGITPGLYAPNWRSSQNPGAWWSNSLPVSGVGIENLSIDATAVSNESGSVIQFDNAVNSWVKNIRSINSSGTQALHKHVWLYQSSHITVRDSYFFGSAGASESYGVDSSFSSSDNLIENNICQHIATCTISEGDTGSVFGYNYAVDNFYTANGNSLDWQQADGYHHSVGDNYRLWEGNEGSSLALDDIHGSSFMLTAFRNYWSGFDPAGGGPKTAQTVPVQIYAYTRYTNLVGNVLGTSTLHSNYTAAAPSNTDCGSSSKGNVSIFIVGYSSEMGTRFAPLGTCPNGLGAAFTMFNDTLAVTTLMRWGNYDTVNSANQFNASEVPSGISPYGNPVPASQNLPPSFYLSGKPAFWSTAFGTPPFPAVGPDVSGGNIPSLGGHANDNPAKMCFENLTADSTYGTPATINSCTQSGSTVSCTATATLPAAFQTNYLVNISGNSVAGYNAGGGYSITAVSGKTFQYVSPNTGLGTGNGGTARVNPVFTFDANSCYGTSGGGPQAPTGLAATVQ